MNDLVALDRQVVIGAIVDFRMLADEAGEKNLSTGPALRAAKRLQDALTTFDVTPRADDLGEAWREAESRAADGSAMCLYLPGGRRSQPLRAWSQVGGGDTRIEGEGSTPAAALRTLADLLMEHDR